MLLLLLGLQWRWCHAVVVGGLVIATVAGDQRFQFKVMNLFLSWQVVVLFDIDITVMTATGYGLDPMHRLYGTPSVLCLVHEFFRD